MLGLLAACAEPLRAQESSPPPRARAATVRLPALGTESERQLRLEELGPESPRPTALLRSAATGLEALRSGRDTLVFLAPEFTFSHNSAHPWGFNDGLLRAGRGANFIASGGVAIRNKRLTMVFIPQWAREANLRFQTIPYPQFAPPTRGEWANPFYPLPTSADLPQRFGADPRSLGLLQGRIALDLGRGMRFGVANEHRWWGPALEQPLLLGSNAPPFRQLFLESDGPIETRAGRFEYQWILGELDESEFFDFDTTNTRRSFSAVAVTWHPGGATSAWPTVGVARGVIAQGPAGIFTALDAFRNVGRPWSRVADTVQRRDQITTLFFRWHVPERGFALYSEWARFEQPASLRDFLTQPGHSQGYTLGGEWARPYRAGTLHARAEFNYLEPSTSIRVRPVSTTYTSASVPQGWTHQGQMLGPGIGPGSSSQWAAMDYHGPRWRLGGSMGRWRRDANYRLLFPEPFKREDLQLYASARVGRDIGRWRALVEFTNGVRLNHLYQAFLLPGTSFNDTEGVDLLNRTLTVTLTPRLSPPAR